MGMKQLQQASPNLYDPIACDTAALRAMGWSNPNEFFVPPAAQAAPPPQLIQMQEQMQNEKLAAQAKVTEANARADEAKAKSTEVQAKIAVGHYNPKQEGVAAATPPPQDTQADLMAAQSKMLDSQTKARQVGLKALELQHEDHAREQDAIMREKESAIQLAGDVIRAPTAGESGKQVNVTKAGKKAKQIIKDVDAGVDGKIT
jgi:hypothetical protein